MITINALIRKLPLFIFCVCSITAFGQQYPWWTQYRANQTLYNPAFCGTKRLLDVRANYRNQWTGFEGSPKTYALTLNSRLWKGRVGVGGFVFKDDIGPFRNLATSITAAYHLKFPDSELSFGVQGNYIQQKFVGTDITLRNQQDKAIDQYNFDKSRCFDGSFGLVYFNDRFHLGVGANNISGSKIEHYKNDSLKKGTYTNVPHYNISAGYNYAENLDFTFENSVLAVFVPGVPISFDYTVRLHMKKQLIAGLGFRLNDAIALHLGYTIKDEIQISYSYDIVTSPLRKYQKGSHEITLIFSSNMGTDKKRRGTDKRFLKQRYQYLIQ
ncbi:MAG: type secretion system rane protein PorP/SprF [Bacteroidota bacterium]|jgi:type IX secretion system PorP/SprF family membrane protein|nr:type secretion system rane protein PorP/SprF [Bacteroidota bacterium]